MAAKTRKAAAKKTGPRKPKTAAKQAPVRRPCALRVLPAPVLLAGGDPLRARLIGRNRLKWANNETLRYMFLDTPATWRGSDANKKAVRDAFAEWKAIGVGLNFVETSDPRERPQIRIGFSQTRNAGSWSYVGRDSVDQVRDMRQRTMNFGWELTDAYGYDTALHEIGHALGFEHEHQNPNAGITWNEDAVYQYFCDPQIGWDRQMVKDNILTKLPARQVSGSNWDPDSIMHYWFEKGLIAAPARYRAGLQPAGGLSQNDISRARHFYPDNTPAPRTLRPLQSEPLALMPDQQQDFEFTPELTRRYCIQTLGQLDTFISLFEVSAEGETFLDADDNSGEDGNASLTLPLVSGRRYIIRLRMHYAGAVGDCALVII